jgi:hypothetical protein
MVWQAIKIERVVFFSNQTGFFFDFTVQRRREFDLTSRTSQASDIGENVVMKSYEWLEILAAVEICVSAKWCNARINIHR